MLCGFMRLMVPMEEIHMLPTVLSLDLADARRIIAAGERLV